MLGDAVRRRSVPRSIITEFMSAKTPTVQARSSIILRYCARPGRRLAWETRLDIDVFILQRTNHGHHVWLLVALSLVP